MVNNQGYCDHGRIITFYSYKGGTGRSMALANVAWILASNGRKVLVIDWDLEAPGLHRYFAPFLLDPELANTEGLIEFVRRFEDEMLTPPEDMAIANVSHVAGEKTMDRMDEDRDQNGDVENWELESDLPPAPLAPEVLDALTDIRAYTVALAYPFPKQGKLEFVPAGRQDAYYSQRVTTFDWDNFYQRLGGGAFMEAFRHKLTESYDYVLIDSRTGICDTSGICTIQLPDALVVCFTANNQSITGAAAVTGSVEKHWLEHRSNENPRPRIFPLFTRIESAEKEKLRLRKQLAFAEFGPFLDHVPESERDVYWGAVQVPYSPFYAYEELLATFGDTPHEEGSVLSALERLTAYLTEDDPKGQISSVIAPTAEERRNALAIYSRNKHASSPPSTPSASDASTGSRRYDFLACYSTRDKQTVTPILTRIAKAGCRYWSDEDDLRPGDDWRSAYVSAITLADNLLVFLGPNGLSKSQADSLSLLADPVTMGLPRPRIVPVLLPGTTSDQIPESLRRITWLNLRDFPDDDSPVRELIKLAMPTASLVDAKADSSADEPFPGQRPFTEQENRYFFGRDREIREILQLLSHGLHTSRSSHSSSWTSRAVILVGPPKSGKTSLVQAGIFPALSSGEVEGSARWQRLLIHPGSDPLANLAFALATLPEFSSTLSRSRELVDAMRKDKSGLQLALRLAIGSQNDRPLRLLTIDSIDDVFTQCKDENDRRSYLDNLRTAIRETDDGLRWLLVVSDEFADHLATDSDWRELITRSSVRVAPFTAEQLRDAIKSSARTAQVAIEGALLDQLEDDFDNGLLDLPLCQSVLRKLWQSRTQDTLSLADYLKDGGTTRITSEYCEQKYQERFSQDQNAVRRILLRCFQPGQNETLVPRDAVLDREFLTRGKTHESINSLLDQMVEAGFLLENWSENDPRRALRVSQRIIGNWERLEGWLYEYRDDLHIRHRLTEAASKSDALWRNDANPREAISQFHDFLRILLGFRADFRFGWLISGEELARINNWASEHQEWLNDSEWNCLIRNRFFVKARKYAMLAAVLYVITLIFAVGYSFANSRPPVDVLELQSKVEQLSKSNDGLSISLEKTNSELTIARQQEEELTKELTDARETNREVRAHLLVRQAEAIMGDRPEVGMLLAIEAARMLPSSRSSWPVERILRENLGDRQWTTLFVETNVMNQNLATRPRPAFASTLDGRTMILGADDELRIHDLNNDLGTAPPIIIPPVFTKMNTPMSWQACAVSPSRRLIGAISSNAPAGKDSVAFLWELAKSGKDSPRQIKQQTLPIAKVQQLVLTSEPSRLCTLTLEGDARSQSARINDSPPMHSSLGRETGVPLLRTIPVAFVLVDDKPNPSQSQSEKSDRGDVDEDLRKKKGELVPPTISFRMDFWNLNATDDPVPSPLATEMEVVSFALSRDERWLAIGKLDGDIRLWDLQAPIEKPRVVSLRIHKGAVRDLLFSPDSKRLYSAGIDRSVVAWDLSTVLTVPTWNVQARHDAAVNSLDLSHEGELLLSASTDGDMRISQTSDKHEVVFRSSVASVRSARILNTPDQTRVVALDNQGNIVMCDARSDSQHFGVLTISRLRRGSSPPSQLTKSFDGRWLVAAGDDIRVLPLKLDDLITLARKDVGRELTPMERAEFEIQN